MRLEKCKNGHVYDADKLGSCPHCSGVMKRLEYEPDTFGRNQSGNATEISVKGQRENLYVKPRRHVGLLVKTKGVDPGKTYALYEGTNRIGRADNLEVSLAEEDTISRNGHAEILYKNGFFLLFPVKEERGVFLNGKKVEGQAELKDRDVLEMGDCRLVFVRFDDVYEG
ncbi:MAG: FHA domain-containing protein [Lachnospiraceae bacterium]|nr:FHA domain-containing protein [Lachnospiraceae bacterium]